MNLNNATKKFNPSFTINRQELLANRPGVSGNIKSSDGIDLAYMAYISPQPKCIIIFYHGGGANYLDYTAMAQQLCDQFACSTFLFDIRGHGQSGGKRGYASSAKQVWEDINSAINHINNTFPHLPIFIAGHSSGAGLVLNYSQWRKKQNVAGYLMVAPELGPRVALQKTTFATANKLVFFLNKISNGYLFKTYYAVHFNYSNEQINKWGCVEKYTVAMSNAVTPRNPYAALINMNHPLYIVIAEDDELINNVKLKQILAEVVKENNHIKYEFAPHEKHIMILKNAAKYIGGYLSSLIMSSTML